MNVHTTSELESSQKKEYTVGSQNDGGTLSGISKLFYGTPNKWVVIYEANRDRLSSPDLIRKGQKLRIP
ncbi:LysM peptidoglycan-binding domain-containing protein [Pelagicoccus mobilis]|uniref:LysM peptidoglycan-binding domain-containing protein n=1 Tax=Pelagicoccus mobilis TaxID=415221 RepID=A0A934S098_9BACT|nr:LysM peptidoglycan-binding domain-containing protein [Pelagicoccus mobilis]